MTAVELLRGLLRAKTVNPPGGEEATTAVLEAYLGDAGFETNILTSPQGRSNFVARLEGPRDRPALVLLSHSDVVPVEEENWSRDPFGGELAEGFIWGRGALDMKSIAAMHVVAAADLARSGQAPKERSSSSWLQTKRRGAEKARAGSWMSTRVALDSAPAGSPRRFSAKAPTAFPGCSIGP